MHCKHTTAGGAVFAATRGSAGPVLTTAQRKKTMASKKKKSTNEQGPLFATTQEQGHGTEPEPEPEPQPAFMLQPMSDWSVGDVGQWVESLAESLNVEWVSALAELITEDELEGDELAAMVPKSLQRQLKRAGVAEHINAATAILALRDQVLASAPRAIADGDDDDDMANTMNVLMMKERLGNQMLMQHRAQALKARDEGFAIPIRRVGDIDCETRKVRLHESVLVEGALGRSALQELVISEWHPMRVVVTGDDAVEVINMEDGMLMQIEQAYLGAALASYV